LQYRYICSVFAIFFLTSCSVKENIYRDSKLLEKKQEVISDLNIFDQNISSYLGGFRNRGVIGNIKEYEKSYFKPWNIQKIDIPLQNAKWAYRAFTIKNSYGENLQPLKNSFFQDIYARSNFNEYATLNKAAITLKYLNIRAFPSDKPLLMNPQKAGEGFPFDYLQNSTIAPNKPLLVSHYSRDKEWVFIESSFAYGWVKIRDIAFVSDEYIKLYKEARKLFFIKESFPIYDLNNNFLFRSRIGMMLPKVQKNLSKDNLFIAVANYHQNTRSYYITSKIPKNTVHEGILKFNKKNIMIIFNEISHVKYGWGGMYGDRDCSSMLRDFFAPFGIWLPRNSYKQSQIGKVISLEGLNDLQKIQKIKNEAVAFETLLYKRGHILLYVGVKDNKIIVLHNTWGIKTKRDGVEGRFIIGKPVFSTLEIGKNLKYYDKNSSILHNLKSMNILTQ